MTSSKKNRTIKKLSYKYKVYFGLFGMAVLVVLIFLFYGFYDFKRMSREKAERETRFTSARVVSQVDERLDNLWQYYLSTVTDDNVLWMLENSVKYSDYSVYHAVQEELADTKIFGDYISGYTLVNFRTGWVLSNKGMYRYMETTNHDEVQALFEKRNDIIDKNYWNYNPNKSGIKQISKEYRTTIATDWMSIVIKLPTHSSKVNGMLIVNVNEEVWKRWILDLLDEYEDAVVLDDEGNTLFATSESFTDVAKENLSVGDRTFCKKLEDGTTYAFSCTKSNVLGWNYYVIKNVDSASFAGSSLNAKMAVSVTVLLLVAFGIMAYVLYQPVDKLVKNVSDDAGVKGDEIDYLQNRFEGYKYDKQMLQQTVNKNRTKIQELFELRLIRGEVRSNDEWEEYFNGLHLEPCKYFASAVMVLNLKGEFETEDTISEDSVCLKLVEETPDEIKKLTWMPLVYNACTMFCIFGDNDEDRMLDKIMTFYEKMQNFAESRFGVRILMGISATHTEHKHIYAAYRESVNALTSRKESDNLEGRDDYHFYLSSMTKRATGFDMTYLKDIQSAVKAVDRDQCYKVVDDFHNYLATLQSVDDSVYLISSLINSILDAATNTNLELSKVFPDGLRKLYREAVEVVEPSRVRRYIKYAIIDPILDARSVTLENGTASIYEQIIKMIEETGGNITLAECAEALNVHQTYIWKVLKMERDKTFSEVADEYKLEMAKKMLLETNLSVNDIAYRLGYTNAQNFIRFFSKATGLTPGKFRKLY